MGFLDSLSHWPVLQQIRKGDVQALSETARSPRSEQLQPRTQGADRVVKSICPYCAVGCGQLVYVKDEKIMDIEGDPDSPISEGWLYDNWFVETCEEWMAPYLGDLVGIARLKAMDPHAYTLRAYVANAIALRRRKGTPAALEQVAQRVKQTREETWEETTKAGHRVHRTLGIAHLGGATLDNEENYLIKKLFTALGIVQVENQARI